MIRRFAAALGFALALVVVGSAQASDDFARKADKVCAATNKKAVRDHGAGSADGSPNPPPAYMKRLAKVRAQLPPLLKSEIQQIDALGQPSGAAARVAFKRWHTVFTTVGISALEASVRGAQTGIGKNFTAPLTKTEKYDTEMQKLEKAIGFRSCKWTA